MIRLLIFPLLLMASAARAEFKCSLDLNYGLVVNENQIRVTRESHTIYQINGRNQLIVKGEWLELNPEQEEQLAEFSSGIHYVVPKMILLASEGVTLAIDTVEHVYTGLVGQDHKSYEKLKGALKRVKGKVREKFVHSRDNYYVGPGSFEQVDELVDKEIEAQIEQAINTSLGGILSAIGGLRSGGDEEAEARMEALSQRLEDMGAEIERQVGPQADSLRRKAVWFCKKLKSLDKVEERLRKDIPELGPYNVFVAGKLEQPGDKQG